jgi:hypothetical protein
MMLARATVFSWMMILCVRWIDNEFIFSYGFSILPLLLQSYSIANCPRNARTNTENHEVCSFRRDSLTIIYRAALDLARSLSLRYSLMKIITLQAGDMLGRYMKSERKEMPGTAHNIARIEQMRRA